MIHFVQELTFGPTSEFIEVCLGFACIGVGLTECFNVLINSTQLEPHYFRSIIGLLYFILGVFLVVNAIG